eukprot:10330182-Heterocapsa_arctica.AAC.1
MQGAPAPPAQHQRTGHPHSGQHRPRAQPTVCRNRACARIFPAVPDPEDGYIRRHCCSSCVSCSGRVHSRRCEGSCAASET